MSKRFGRNQKRKMRQQIEDLQASMELDRYLIDDQGKRLRRYENELDEAKRMVAPYSAVFKARVLHLGGKPQDQLRVIDGPRAPAVYDSNAPIEDLVMRQMSLPVMLADVDEGMAGQLHVRVRYDGERWGYAITRQVILTAPKDVIVERIAMDLAHQIVRDIRGGHQ